MATLRPDLASEWDTARNESLKPTDIRARWHRRLTVRVTLYGLSLLILSVVAVVGVGRAFLGSDFDGGRSAVARWVARRTMAARGDPLAIRRELEEIGLALRMAATVYDRDGRVLGSTVSPPLPPPSPNEVDALADGELHRVKGHYSDAMGIFDGAHLDSYVVVGYSLRRGLVRMPLVMLGSILFLLVLGSLYFARSLTAPLGKLSSVAQAFGAGDLEARTGFRRGDEIADLGRSFDHMADQIVQLLRAQKELLAGVSHELRTPLARLRVALELVQDGDADQAKNCLPELGQDLAELERLVDDILITTRLDFAQGARGQLPVLHRTSVYAGDVVASSASRFRSLYAGRTLELEVAEGLPRVDADTTLLRRAIDNLLDNAQKYSPADAPVRLSAKRDAGGVLVEVVDHGSGISEDDLAHVFTPFFRGDRSRTRHTGGTGLGLALAQRILGAHGGTLELESRLGQGTTARVRLPEDQVPPPDPRPILASGAGCA